MPHTISLRLQDSTFENLDKLCRELERNKSYIIKKALNQYISSYADYQIALDRLRNKDDEIISSDEMRNRLGL
ncbi:MAG: ribbon-helix-helix protein, CopG family [Candidatus Cloacimonetes bacterium]|nr:ribbon-helix-helix protein, CopG family [Candidatus Cloacimonadota bacterium]